MWAEKKDVIFLKRKLRVYSLHVLDVKMSCIIKHFRNPFSLQLFVAAWLDWKHLCSRKERKPLQFCLFSDRCGGSGQPVKQSRCMFLPRMWPRYLSRPCPPLSGWLQLPHWTPTLGYCRECHCLPAQPELQIMNSAKVKCKLKYVRGSY